METIMYVRFGQPPEGGQSRNRRDGHLEAGVSCHRIVRHGGQWYLDDAGIGFTTLFDDRPQYRLHGDVVGTGSDGEPLLRVDRCTRYRGDIRALPAIYEVIRIADARIYRHRITGQVKLGHDWLSSADGFDQYWRDPEALRQMIGRHWWSKAHPAAARAIMDAGW